ncbi:centrosomal protein POC5 isoform X1 [Python bivittatus]|uniref:Centrosomal protein POC5 n=1 Tax=Python bivittatus TaxID=176946 RepID=A0A9F5MY14_PYTBI|nr:centrosomal protein POC5 isoform X1 [Python bivittatus]XP_025030514.1 centrosomal protein POC5 isoform X1 [Python bivittatus]
MSSSEEKSTSPVLPKDSDRGSSVSSDLQDEYEELLRYAVVTPKFEPSALQQSDHVEVRQISAGKSPVMNDCRHESAGMKWRKHGRAPDLATSSRTTRIEVSASVKESAHVDMERLCPVRSEESSSPGSSSSQRDLQETYVTDLSLSDERVTQIESILDLWSGSLKTNVLTELRKWKLHFIEHHTLEMRQEREKHAAHVRQLTNQMENLKELLHTYEISIGRKDEVIANLTHAIEKQKDRIELMKKFTKWRLQHFVGKQKAREEVYTNRLADRLYEIGLLKKAWAVWRSHIRKKWKETMERAVQSSAESLRAELSNDYETKFQALNVALEETRSELIEMQNKRQDYEDAMKKAFMRGVCALNLEAMTIFQGKDFKFDPVVDLSEKKAEPGAGTGGPTAKLSSFQYDQPMPSTSSLPPPPPPPHSVPTAAPSSTPKDDLFSSHQGHAVTSQTRLDSAAVLTTCGAAIGSGTTSISKLPMTRVVTSAQQKAGRTVTAKITGRPDFATKNRICSNLDVLGVSPPMNSVVVEKHHPITQQTISQATAAKYPRTLHQFSSAISIRHLGHNGKTHTEAHSNIQSIKVVE